MRIAVTGTPGVGKSSVSKKLAEAQDLEYISLNDLAREKGCIKSWDEERRTDVVDLDCLEEVTSDLEDCVIDGHLSHFLDCDYVFVLRCRPKLLRKRMKSKGWDEEKVRENLDAEIVNVIGKEARGGNGKAFSIDTSEKEISGVVEAIIKLIEDKNKKDQGEMIDWISRDGVEIP